MALRDRLRKATPYPQAKNADAPYSRQGLHSINPIHNPKIAYRDGFRPVAIGVIAVQSHRIRVAIFLAPVDLAWSLVRVVVWSKYVDVEILRLRSPRQHYPCFPCSQNIASQSLLRA